MYLGVLAQHVDEVVGVGRQPRYHAVQVLVDGVDLLADLALLQQEGGLVLLSGQYHALLGDDAYLRGGVPMEEPVLLMASTAYSSCISRPPGVKVVVRESYLRDI